MTSCQPHHVSSRVFNQNSVKEALKSIQMKLKLFRELPTNGLAIFNGSYETGEGKIIKVNHAFEPPKPLHRGLYLCDDKFHTDIVREQLQDKTKIGVVVLDGKGAWWFALCGNARERLFKLEVDLPAKHGRGGQSANRFARLREERRDWYLKKVMEICERVFIGSDHAVNVEGIILAGCADLKNELFASQFLDQRIKAKVIKVVDTQYGGEAGFNEVLLHCEDLLRNQKLMKERETLQHFFTLIANDSGLCSYGLEDTLFALEMGGVERLVVSQDLKKTRCTFSRRAKGGEEKRQRKRGEGERQSDGEGERDEKGKRRGEGVASGTWRRIQR
eukprot:TRINITY_DN1290_c0_g1_i3.p1 TRINITY_DN1290_c0_g1~~TRINITY_DN1290_c0_g1_i3.p1  ORF type:complete len:332 (-),score=80.93 TRINITY_DN1290_c0_g1_i3:286-1281(-)